MKKIIFLLLMLIFILAKIGFSQENIYEPDYVLINSGGFGHATGMDYEIKVSRASFKKELGKDYFIEIKNLIDNYMPGKEYRNFGPDSFITVIEIVLEGKKHYYASWHTNSEKNSDSFATSSGIISLNGRSPEELLQAQPEEYQNFRKGFDAIIKLTLEAVNKNIDF